MIRIKRAYEPAASSDGVRVLVERLWPRGISKERAALDFWTKNVAPSPELRRWFGHDPARWDEFRRRYWAELDAKPEAVEALRREIEHKTATLVYSSRDTEHNAAVALREYLEGVNR